jgi:hypothetical protein
LIFPLKKKTTIIRTAHLFAQAIYENEKGKNVNELYKKRDNIKLIEKLFNMKRSTSFEK